ncbi:hypothetical protein NMC42_26590 [Pseudomonas aeruginosa]
MPIVDTSETVPDGFAMGMKRCHFAEAGHHRRVRVQVEQGVLGHSGNRLFRKNESICRLLRLNEGFLVFREDGHRVFPGSASRPPPTGSLTRAASVEAPCPEKPLWKYGVPSTQGQSTAAMQSYRQEREKSDENGFTVTHCTSTLRWFSEVFRCVCFYMFRGYLK